ncbi:MAG: thioredoxin domain-containing protein [Verrucomicrobia bacterium]|nr:thioredoxin domain-containing protein [Verrucomicrobiota bacterium]
MPNALIHETSPYLLQHANNPVAWQPWGEAAFAQARAGNQLVFLSIGYSTCHWCHVMEHESFENPDIARVMNEHFINLKVDREERPDLDATYMAFVQASTGQGGWPLSVWLTPDGKAVFGGTYFPPIDSHGRPGFPRVCHELARLWRDDRARLETSALEMSEHLKRRADCSPPPSDLAGPQVCGAFLDFCQRRFDGEWGGFGGAPKFPRPTVLRTLMQLMERFGPDSEAGASAWSMAERTLRAMALGGMHDHLGGGFHRYSVDRYWHVPHYEKMLYDQAQLAMAYLDGWQISHDPAFCQVAEGIFAYLLETLRDADGAFHAAEDADSLPTPAAIRKQEGAFWTWGITEIFSLLDARDATIFSAAHGVKATGNARPDSDPHGALNGLNTLFRALPDSYLAGMFACPEAEIRDSLHAAAKILLEARSRRPLPHRDDKIVTAWNGLAIGALARGARVLNREDLAAAATAAASFIRRELWDGESLFRSFRVRRGAVPAFPADYVLLISGLLELHAVAPADDWLGWAQTLQQRLDAGCWDAARSGYVMRPTLGDNTLSVIREDYDGAEPSPNHLAAENLLKLASLLDDREFLTRAESLLRAGTEILESQPFAAPLLLAALDLHQRGVMKFQTPAAIAPAVLGKLQSTYFPRAVHTAGEGDSVILCEGFTCRIFSG